MSDDDSYQAQRLKRMQQNAAKLADLQACDCGVRYHAYLVMMRR
jgi:hypothetical protein